MDIQQFLRDNRAASPVIGVILMVAVTVILASIIGSFVLGAGNDVSDVAPKVGFGFVYDDTVDGTDAFGDAYGPSSGTGLFELTVTHNSGETVEAGTLSVVGGGTDRALTYNNAFGSTDLVNSGTSFTYAVAPDDTVRVVWKGIDGVNNDNTAVLARWDGPTA